MEFKAFLIKYAEIGVKGKNRFRFEDALIQQMRYALQPVGEFSIRKESGRIFVDALEEYDYDEAVEALSRVFGIAGICPIVVEENKDFDHIAAVVCDYVGERYEDRTFSFKVNVRRADKKYPIKSMDVAALLGEKLLERYEADGLHVNVREPDVLLTVEIRDKVYIYSDEIPGPGGMPVGTGGRAMLLLSGGIDSPVAGYMISKRGVSLEATYFHAPPYTSERAKQKVVDLAKLIARYTGPITLHIVNFTDIQMAIYEKCPHDELTIIMRRYMMKIAEHFAKESGCLALVTGESIGQVASQTMQSLYVTNEVCEMPVFRPCIGMDKQDIVELSERIGTYETSILPYEDCCTIFVAKHPVTKPRLDVIKKSERKLDDCIDELLKTAIETEEVVKIHAH
ncbi:MAG TPA: tRNA 4-thiouridine(8) synthase ThiI [Candidatus Anaerobutyricum stercoris]|uniref:Probable tRNA sulfurtransferase n=1 Tax=Candidatus Anaerobutyricum stercoris TaxID=2838457 RepID=A0A9D2J8P6_9FIRM|nr:tRNA uracil 4-sulfurtransferase ThiI [Eubacterium sp. An3]OUO28602.1 tRNA 4-thiouridine(8) synthase ThiI [Eubacterium sp. An3]CVI72964.1 putative tRNA sulfurtransferase [Eubacteriaceae bacterium CHKCI004]HIZ40598.1 tRNA 4-thiouridine(8) synthase ThiI [Candidatus Anaerobutyricum stercoris]